MTIGVATGETNTECADKRITGSKRFAIKCFISLKSVSS